MDTINKLFQLIKKYECVLFLFLLVLFPFLSRIKEDVQFIHIVLTSNYITLIINVYFLMMIYKKIKVINGLRYHLITRLGLKKVKTLLHVFVSLCTIIFCLILYLFLFAVYGCKDTNLVLIGLLIGNTIVYLIEANFVFLQFHKKTNILYIIIPMMINFAYHYILFIK